MSGLATAALVVLAICGVLWTIIMFVAALIFFFTVIPLLKGVQRDLSRLLDSIEKELRGTLRSAQSVGREVKELVSIGNRFGREAVFGMVFNRPGMVVGKSRWSTLFNLIELILMAGRLLSRPRREGEAQARVPIEGE